MGKKPSSTSKKAWRKKKEADQELRYGLEEATHNERHGTDFELIPSAELFFEDKAGAGAPAPEAAEQPAAARGKQRKLLKSEAILKAGHTAKPLVSQRKKQPKVAQKPVKRPAPQRQEVASLDLWGGEAQPSTAPAAAAPGKRRRRAAVGGTAVEVDQPGCSYNPDADQHQDAVAAAVAAEMAKSMAAELAPQAPALMVDAGGAETDELGLLQVDEETDDVPPSEDEATAAAGVDRRMPEQKTRTQRNREQRKKQAEAELQVRKQQKESIKSINQLKQLAAELEAEEEARAAKLLRKQIMTAEKRAGAPPRLGKTPFVPEPVQVLLTEELSSSLRGLKPSATLARERFKSLQKRGILEPRSRVRKHVGKRIASQTYANRQADRDDASA